MAIDVVALSTALQNLANVPGAAQLLGGHLTTSQEMQAVDPPKIGKASTRPTLWASRGIGASFFSDRCAQLSL
jgi:hypothetical protein